MNTKLACAALLMSLSLNALASENENVAPPPPPPQNEGTQYNRDVGSSVVIFELRYTPAAPSSEYRNLLTWLGLDAEISSEQE